MGSDEIFVNYEKRQWWWDVVDTAITPIDFLTFEITFFRCSSKFILLSNTILSVFENNEIKLTMKLINNEISFKKTSSVYS